MFVRAIGKFFERLNPLVQAQELGGLAKDAARGAWRVAVHTIIHPLATAEKVSTVTQQGIAFLRSTADFVSDITVGRLYLPEAEYQKRVDSFKNGINAIPVGQLKQLTAENWVDLGAHVAADFVFCKGFSSAFIYLKEIDAMTKVQQQAAKVARTFKKAVDTHLADNPILVTAEGVVIKMSKNMKDVGEKLKNSSIGQKVILRVANMKEFFDLPFGKTLHPHSLKTPYQYQSSSIYKLTNDIPGTELKEGYFYYLDRLHRDHIEVFNKKLKAIAVYNLDGTLNEKKLEAARKAGRNITKFMK